MRAIALENQSRMKPYLNCLASQSSSQIIWLLDGSEKEVRSVAAVPPAQQNLMLLPLLLSAPEIAVPPKLGS